MVRLSFLLVILLLSGCSDDNGGSSPTGPSPGSTGLMPLVVGNEWLFDLEINDLIEGELKWEVISSSVIQGETWYQNKISINLTNGNNPSDDLFYLTNRDNNGVYYKANADATAEWWWKYPAVEDDTWTTLDSEVRTVIDTNSEITVPAGTITGCYWYAVVGQESLELELIKPDEGPVALGWTDGQDEMAISLKAKTLN